MAVAVLTDISAELKRLRLAKKLTTAEVARRAGTSAATLSRYENGWSRFEVYTLRKLATAMGLRLELSWRPLHARQSRESRSAVARRLGRLFWDRPLAKADLARFPDWVVGRVVQYGTLRDVRALAGALGKQRFLATVAGLRLPSPRLQAFWEAVLDLEGVQCTKKRSRPQAASSWPG